MVKYRSKLSEFARGAAHLPATVMQTVTKPTYSDEAVVAFRQERRRTLHPMGLNTTYEAVDDDATDQVKWKVMQNNSACLVFHSVQESSRRTYSTGWKRFCKFSTWFGTDCFLRVAPQGWSQVATLPTPFRETVVMSFTHKRSVEGLVPVTVNTYVSDVRFMLKSCNLDVSFMETDIVCSARTAIELQYRLTHPASDTGSLPFTIDMVMHARNTVLNTGSTAHQAVNTAMTIATVILGRASEYLQLPSDHHLRSQDVRFRLHNLQDVVASEAWRYTLDDVQSVMLTVRSAKNDPEGFGSRFQYVKGSLSATCVFDPTADLFSWAARARPMPDHPFLSYRGEWTLTYKMMTKGIKDTVRSLGFKPKLYSTHGIRIASASTLAAAGVPDSVIQKTGRWKSLTFLRYIRVTRATFAVVIAAITNPTHLTMHDVAAIHPGVH
jgi:hypothetical protein